MRFRIVAFFLCTGVTATCQSTARAPVTPEAPGGITQESRSLTNCKTQTADLTIPSFAPRVGDRRSGGSATWNWDETQVNSKSASHASVLGSKVQINSKNAFSSPVLNSEAKPCTLVAQEDGLPSGYRMLFQKWPDAKTEPIPTQWPNLKIEKIPTEWQNLKFVPVNTSPPPPSK